MKSKTILSILMLLVGFGIFGYFMLFFGGPAAGCVATGGELAVTQECGATDNFHNTCRGVGACAPEYSANKFSCHCPSGCFDGFKCVDQSDIELF